MRIYPSATAAELLSVIVLAMCCPDPRVGMELLGEGVGVVLGRRKGESPPPEPTALAPLRDADPPLGWDFADPQMQRALKGE